MSVPRMQRAASTVVGVNVVVLSDRSEVRLDEIQTADEGRRVLADVDAAILSIEAQLEFGDGDEDPTWRGRAEATLKLKRRIRPALERRIGELRRAEHVSSRVIVAQAYAGTVDAKRKAFVETAETMLDRDLFTEIWVRAGERHPEAFPNNTRPH